MRIGPIGPLWAQQFLAAAFWAGMATLWAIGNSPSDIRPVAFWIAVAGAVIYVSRGIYALVNPPKAQPPERTAPEEPDAEQMIIYIVLACTVLFAVYTGFWLFIELGKMQR